MKISFVSDLLRAETIWQDRRFEPQYNQGPQAKKISYKPKQNCPYVITVYMSDKENVFIFKFEERQAPMGRIAANKTQIKEVSKNVFLFECQALKLEDIVLDMRDRITNELMKVERNGYRNAQNKDLGFVFSDNFIKEVDGKMEFLVRNIVNLKKGQRASIGGAIE